MKETLVDALQIAIVRFVYDDIGELCLYPTSHDVYSNERQHAIALINLLVVNSRKSNPELIAIFMQRLNDNQPTAVPTQLKVRLLTVLNNATELLEHRQLEKVLRKNSAATANDTYIQRLWKKPSGFTDGSLGVKRIALSDSDKNHSENNATKYLHRWLIKIDMTGEHSRAEYIRQHYGQAFLTSRSKGKERTLESGRIITSKWFHKFITLNDFLQARIMLLSAECTGIMPDVFYKFFNKDKIIALDPIYIHEKNLYLYGKPALGLAYSLALAFIYNSIDIHHLKNIGFSDGDHYVQFELLDFGGYKTHSADDKIAATDKKLQLKTLMSGEITHDNYQKILQLIIPRDTPLAHQDVLASMITKEMIATELRPILNGSAPPNPIPDDLPVLNGSTIFNTSIWNWKRILAHTADNVTNKIDFEIWCIQTLHYMEYFPTECAHFICALHDHPALRKEDGDHKTTLGTYIDDIISAPQSQWVNRVHALSIDSLHRSSTSCTIS